MRLVYWKYHPIPTKEGYVPINNLDVSILIHAIHQLKWENSGVALSNRILTKLLGLNHYDIN